MEKINNLDVAAYIVAIYGHPYIISDSDVYIDINPEVMEKYLITYKQSAQRKVDRIRKTLIGTTKDLQVQKLSATV